jgi:hypothetical protein
MSADPSPAACLVPCDDDDRWDDFVRSSPHGSVFVRSTFLRALPDHVDRWFLERDDEVVAAAVQVVDVDGVPLDQPRPFTQYQGILLAPSVATGSVHRRVPLSLQVGGDILDALADRYPRLALCLHHRTSDSRFLSWFRYGEADTFRVESWYTGLIDVSGWQGIDAYLASIRTSRRQDHRRAVRAGYNVEVSNDVDTLVDLYRRTFERQGDEVPAATISLVRAIAAAAIVGGFGEILTCAGPDGPASSVLSLHDDDAAYYLVAGNDPAQRSSGSGTRVVVELVSRAAERGLHAVDVCGMNSPQRGDFKSSLGAVPVPYTTGHWDPT